MMNEMGKRSVRQKGDDVKREKKGEMKSERGGPLC
jgi:hypothetical protein